MHIYIYFAQREGASFFGLPGDTQFGVVFSTRCVCIVIVEIVSVSFFLCLVGCRFSQIHFHKQLGNSDVVGTSVLT